MPPRDPTPGEARIILALLMCIVVAAFVLFFAVFANLIASLVLL